MELKQWLQEATPAQRQTLADRAETTVNYLYQLAGGFRAPRMKLAQRIEKATKSSVALGDWPK